MDEFSENDIHISLCDMCSNRGKTIELSEESHCDHCIYQEKWRRSHYLPKTNEKLLR